MLSSKALFAQTSCDLSVLDEASMWDIVCNIVRERSEEKNRVKTGRPIELDNIIKLYE